MTDNEIFEAVKQRFTDPKVMDLLRNGLADPEEMEVVKRALRYGDAAMTVPSLRSILYKVFDRLLNVVKDDSTTRQMVKQDLRQLQKGDSDMSEDLNTAINEVTRQKSSVSWTRAVIGPGKSHHSGRGYHELGHSKSDSELESSVHKAVEKGKKTGDVLHHHIQQHDDGTRTHHITLNPSVYKDLHHTVAIHTGRPVAHVSFTIPEKHTNMSEDLNTANVTKAVAHDCAKHVVHEQWGKGQCIAGEHTLLDDGTVTHYDVMFEHGIEQDVPVADLQVVVSESHMHASKKRKPAMEEEAVAPEGGEDSSKASKKGKPEMPLEKLKAILEKKKSEAYKAMLRSQGKMEEEAELDEKTLTKAEMKKREEVAKAIERDQPGMPMGKKMAIATSTAKKVAETYEALKESSDHEKLANKLYGHQGTTRTGEPTYFEGPMKHSDQDSNDKARLDKHVPAAKEHGSHVFRIDGAKGLVVHHKKGITALSSKNEVHHFEHGEEGHKKLQAHISKKFGMPHDDENREVEAGAWKTSKKHKAEMQKHYDDVKAYVAHMAKPKSQGKMEENTLTKAVAEELVGNQHRIDANKNGKIDAHDFKLLKAKKKTMKEFVEKLAESLSPKAE